MKIADIVINIPTRELNQTFSYYIPSDFDFLTSGWRVIVSFGNRHVEGFILSADEGDPTGLKPIEAVLDDFAWFDNSMLELACWLSKYYLCTLAEAMRLFVPGKQGIKTETYYCLATPCKHQLFSDNQELLAFIEAKQPVRKSSLLKRFGVKVQGLLGELVKAGVLCIKNQAKTREKPSYSIEYRLAEPAALLLANYERKPAQRRLIEYLLKNEAGTKESLKSLNISDAILKKMLETNVLISRPVERLRNSYAGYPSLYSSRKVLTAEQINCLKEITNAINTCKFHPFLLHGITGSGKTEIYIEAAAAARKQGRQIIVLVPEIALTGQIIERFKNRFSDDIVVFHSKLSLPERYDAWRRLREERAGIAIGARSALFAPVKNLGLIIIDEEHEFSYKQEESPRYHAREVALQRAKLAGAAVIMGSATPAVESYHSAISQRYQLLRLANRADSALLPTVEAVDMRAELASGRRSVISERLSCLLQETVARGEQAIILLNRRGHSTFLLCRECGHVMRCRHCAVSLVYHAENQTLRCHYCYRQQPVPDICPVCQSRYIRYFGTGTQKAEEAIKQLLPNVRLLRMDQDTTAGQFAADRILRAFREGKYDILIGTQMVAKGHDIPNVTAVGILAADSMLNLPDFRAAEKTFSLITQAAGRAGRGQKAGQVIVQTYNPEHYAIQAGLAQDYLQFYQCEAEFRRSLNYPPFTNLIRCTVASENETAAHRDAERLATVLRHAISGPGIEILGPFPSSIAKVKDIFRVNILIKHVSDIKPKLSSVPELSKNGVSLDVDPCNML